MLQLIDENLGNGIELIDLLRLDKNLYNNECNCAKNLYTYYDRDEIKYDIPTVINKMKDKLKINNILDSKSFINNCNFSREIIGDNICVSNGTIIHVNNTKNPYLYISLNRASITNLSYSYNFDTNKDMQDLQFITINDSLDKSLILCFL